jgi:hypothetical protein
MFEQNLDRAIISSEVAEAVENYARVDEPLLGDARLTLSDHSLQTRDGVRGVAICTMIAPYGIESLMALNPGRLKENHLTCNFAGRRSASGSPEFPV